jgi:thiamine biosynthesis protein ThiS
MITVGEEKIPWQEGMTVARVLEALQDEHFYAVVRVNGKLVSRPNFKKTPVPDNAEIILIPMIAGG